MFITRNRRTLLRSATAALAASGLVVLGGCGGTAGPETGTDVSDIQNDPAGGGIFDDDAGADGFEDFADVNSFVGQTVTVSAEVSEVVGPNAFTIADESGEALLVVYDGSPSNLNVDTGIIVTGTVYQAFNIAEVEGRLGVELDDEAFADFGGEPYIQASMIDTTTQFDQGETG